MHIGDLVPRFLASPDAALVPLATYLPYSVLNGSKDTILFGADL